MVAILGYLNSPKIHPRIVYEQTFASKCHTSCLTAKSLERSSHRRTYGPWRWGRAVGNLGLHHPRLTTAVGASQCRGEGQRLCSRVAWFPILALPYISCVTLGKLQTSFAPVSSSIKGVMVSISQGCWECIHLKPHSSDGTEKQYGPKCFHYWPKINPRG